MKNKYEIRGDVTAIFIYFKGNVYETLIDTEDLPLALEFPFTWLAKYSKKTRTIYVGGQIVENNKKRVYVALHRKIMGAPTGLEVDHIDHDTLNNRRKSNLRIVTTLQNNHNRRTSKNNKVGQRGVYYNKEQQKWIVNITIEGRRRTIGKFLKKEDAIEMSRKALSRFKSHSPEAILYESLTEDFKLIERNRAEKQSGIKGIKWHKSNKKWNVSVRLIEGKWKSFGYYNELQDAVEKLESVKKEYQII